MGFFSSIGNAFKKVGSAVGGAVKSAVSVVKKVATPLLSTAAGLVPGIGPLLAAGVDILGNKLLGSDAGDASQDSGQVENNTVMEAVVQVTGKPIGLGTSPAAQAMANATAAAEGQSAANFTSSLESETKETKKGFLGIGDGKPGVFGIGDGKPGVFGIGTGKAKAKKQAAEAARAQAEAKAKGEGLEPKIVKLKGDLAAAEAEKKVDDEQDKPATSGSGGGIGWLIGGALALLALG